MSNVTRQFNLDLNVYQLPNPNQVVLDADTGERLQFYRANSLDFSITFAGESGDFDMSSVGKISLEVKQPSCSISPPRPLAPLQMYKEVEGPFSTGTPVVISFDADETAIADGVNWMSVTLYSASGERMTTVSGTVFVLGNGYGTANVPDVQDLRDQAVQAAVQSCACADRSEAAAIIAEDEADRAQNIADNLQSVGEALSYRGTWSGGAAPSGAQRGYFWVIASPATWGSITWAVGDAALYNGSTWQRVAIDWLLAQANANIAALSQQIDRSKRPFGGVRTEGTTAQTARFWVPGYTVHIGGGDTEVSFFIEAETHPVSSPRMIGCGFNGGWMLSTRTSDNLLSLTLYRSGSSGAYATATWTRSAIFTERTHVAMTFKNITTAPELELFINGVSQGVQTPAINGAYGESVNNLTVGADMPAGTNVCNGIYSCVQVFSRHLTPSERLAIVSSGGKAVPVSARSDLELNLPCDDGAGEQLRDMSGKGRHGLLGLSGCDHLIVKDRGKITQGATNYTSGTYLLGDRPILPDNAYVTGLIMNDEVMPLNAYYQTPALRQIRIIDGGGGSAWLQRSNGTTHETLVETPHGLTGLSIALTWEVV